MAIHLVYLLISTAVLAKSSEIVVDHASLLSRYFGISQLAAGMVLLAVITSLPELSVAVVSGSLGEGAVSAGNVFGSNVANILLVLGAVAFLYGVKIPRKKVGEIGIILLITTVISVYMVFSSQVYGTALNFFTGVFLLAAFAAYAYHLLKKKEAVVKAVNRIHKKKALKSFLFFVGGMIIVFVSSGFVVENAVITAENFGVAQSLIGATLIAAGTSLPELSTTLHAARKRKYGMAAGNVIGSNMTNLTLVLGTTAVLGDVEIRLPVFVAAILFAVVVNAVLLYLTAIRKNMGRYTGLAFLVFYLVFIIAILGLQTTAA